MKSCSKCKEERPYGDFHKDKRHKDGLTSHCKDCYNSSRNRWLRNHYMGHKDYYRDRQYRSKYGITLKDFEEMSLKQEHKCDICKRFVKKLHIDHNHKTGKIRKLLCTNCNRGLGYAQEDIAVLENMIRYLKEN